MHYYSHNIGEFALDTKFFTFEQKGIFVDMVDTYLATGKPLANEWVANIERLASEGAVKFVLSTHFELKDGFWHNEKLDSMLEEYEIKAEKNRENAKKPRKRKTSENQGELAVGLPLANESLTTNNQEPITNNQNNITFVESETFNKDSGQFETLEDFGIENENGAECGSDTQHQNNTVKRCPYQRVIEVYHRLLPTLPTVNTELFSRNKADQAVVKARWQDFAVLEKCQNEGEVLYCFERYFQIVQKSKFLLGQTQNGTWKADFRWLMKKANFEKVLELKYS